MDVVALVTARGGSKGIPGKNLVPVAGKPLLTWTIEAALASRAVRRIVVSTDDEAIRQTALEAGAEVPFVRPAQYAQDHSSHLSVVLHALEFLETEEGRLPDYLLLLQPTSPLRLSSDIDAAIALAIQSSADSVVSVCETHHHPLLVKRISEQGRLVDYLSVDRKVYLRRQDLPSAYALNGAIYLTRPQVLRIEGTFLPDNTVPYVMPQERSLDLDTPWDLKIVRWIMEDRTCPHEPSASPHERSVVGIPASSLRKPA